MKAFDKSRLFLQLYLIFLQRNIWKRVSKFVNIFRRGKSVNSSVWLLRFRNRSLTIIAKSEQLCAACRVERECWILVCVLVYFMQLILPSLLDIYLDLHLGFIIKSRGK